MDIIKQTNKMKQYIDVLKTNFDKNEPPESFSDSAFFLKVKEETAPIYELLSTWEEDALALIKKQRLQVHPHQIFSTKENIELLLMHSYYIDCRRRRYMELYQSIHYILDQILEN